MYSANSFSTKGLLFPKCISGAKVLSHHVTSVKRWKGSLQQSDSFPTNKRNNIKKTKNANLYSPFFSFNQFVLCALSHSFSCRQSEKWNICWSESSVRNYFFVLHYIPLRRLTWNNMLCGHVQVLKTEDTLDQSNTFFKTFDLWVTYQKQTSGHFERISANITTHNNITLILKKMFTSTFDHFL